MHAKKLCQYYEDRVGNMQEKNVYWVALSIVWMIIITNKVSPF